MASWNRRLLAAGAAVVLGALGGTLTAPMAHAHGSDPGLQDVVDGMDPHVDGVQFSLVESIVPELSATNDSGRTIEILDRKGQPYLRLGPRGAEGNLNSPELYLSNDPSHTATVPARARQRGAAPAWTTLNDKPSWAWFDPRVRYDIESPPADVVARNEDATLTRWHIPLRLDGTPAQLNGAVRFEPPHGAALAALSSPMNPADGVTVALTPGSYPNLFVSNSSGDELTILGGAGEPFARIGPRGTEVNLLSPTHVADVIARHETPERRADPSARPQWHRVSGSPSYSWLEQRARTSDEEHERGEAHPDRRQTLSTWTVPAQLGDRAVDIRGTIRWEPALSTTDTSKRVAEVTGTSSWVLPTAVPAAVLIAGALLLWRRARARSHAG